MVIEESIFVHLFLLPSSGTVAWSKGLTLILLSFGASMSQNYSIVRNPQPVSRLLTGNSWVTDTRTLQMQLREGTPLSLRGTRFARLEVLANNPTPNGQLFHVAAHHKENPRRLDDQRGLYAAGLLVGAPDSW